MMAQHYDVIVVGLGAMGSAALYQASRRGAKALGIDRYEPPHTLGSSHGDTRITRSAIGEGEFYLPFVRRSDEIWRELEANSGRTLFHRSGGLRLAPPKLQRDISWRGRFCRSAARVAGGTASRLKSLTLTKDPTRHSAAETGEIDRAYYEPGAGVLRPSAACQRSLIWRGKPGATIRTGEKVTDMRRAPTA